MTIAEQIRQKLTNSYGMTRAELAMSLHLTRDGIRKALNKLVADGEVHREQGDDGVEVFSLQKEEEMPSDVAELKPMEEVGNAMVAASVPTYEEGFAMGFAAAQKLNYSDAFHAGKLHVVNKLKSMLI